MDDLAGLDWSKSASSQKPAQSTFPLNTTFSNLKPTPPVSGRATPQSSAVSPKPPSKPATPAPANDSFANLVSWSSNPSNAKPSLQEQQKRLADLKIQQQSKSQSTWASGDDAAWNNLGSGRSTPAPTQQQNGKPVSVGLSNDDDDIFATFNDAKSKPSKRTLHSPAFMEAPSIPPDDDDPFGLAELQQKKPETMDTTSTPQGDDGDDDVLGLLGKPFDPSQRTIDQEAARTKNRVSTDHPRDKAIADLVDMGFPADRARLALQTTKSGTDVQAAVSYLLNAAHQEARDRSQSRNPPSNGYVEDVPHRGRGGHTNKAASQRSHVEDDDGPVMQRRQQQRPQSEKDPGQLAAEFGSTFLKTAGSLWKQGQKRVQQAVQEFNSDSETGGQPKWLRENDHRDGTHPRDDDIGPARRRRRSSAGKKQQRDVTDEAMMLEGQRPTPPLRQTQKRAEPRFESSADTSRDHSPAVPSRLRESASPQPVFVRQQQAKPITQSSRSALNRQANEEIAAQAYVSSARRRKPAAPTPSVPEPDLFEASSPQPPAPRPQTSRPAHSAPKATPVPSRPPPPKRNIPPVPPLSLKASHTARLAGNEYFKRGDYSSAHSSYSTSLNHLPAAHPITLVLLTNRALTALKTGEPKIALTDCDTAITLIGASKGESETLDFLDDAPPKPMRDYYGKALMRKAEALEQMEKWGDAASVWREAVEGGFGGATSMQGRLRAEKAADPASHSAKPFSVSARRKTPTAAAPRRPASAAAAAAAKPQGDSAAVTALRAANLAADKADDERFALSDSVSARIDGWRSGKEGNLRALLASLDTVLWEGANWKKVGMGELVLPGKVKIQYMKGIGRVHPDKIPTDATTEQRMISAAVFSALNEAWDKFKTENGL